MKVFIENQRFNQWWLFVILAIPLVSVFVAFISKEENELSKSDLIIFLVSLIFIMLIDIFIFSIQLKTRIDENGVHYHLEMLQ